MAESQKPATASATAILFRFRAELRDGWRSVVVSIMIVGIATGASLSAFAAAERTSSVFQRFVDASRSNDVLVLPGDAAAIEQLTTERLQAMEGVEVASAGYGFFAASTDRTPLEPSTITMADSAGLRDIDVPIVRQGRLPDPSRADEVFATPAALPYLHITVGQTFQLVVWPEANFGNVDQLLTDGSLEDFTSGAIGETRTFTLVGVGLLAEQIATPSSARLIFTKAFYDETRAGPIYVGIFVGLADNTDIAAFEANVRRAAPGSEVSFQTLEATRAKSERILRPQIIALVAFAIVMAIASLAAWAQAATRRSKLMYTDDSILQTLGMTSGERRRVELLRTVVVAVAAAVLGLGVAVLASRWMPIGEARRIEPDLGFDFNPSLLLGGAATSSVLAIAIGVVTSRRSSSTSAQAARVSVVAQTVRGALRSPSMTTGLSHALEPARGRDAAPTRSTLIGATAGVLVVAAVTTFAVNLREFVNDPRAYGWGYDAAIDVGDVSEDGSVAVLKLLDRTFQADPAVRGWGTAIILQAQVGGRPDAIMGIGLEDGEQIGPTVVHGRLPTADTEVALGERTARAAGVSVGDSVTIGEEGNLGPFTVVGIVVLPGLPTNAADIAALGGGALLTMNGAAAVAGIDDPHPIGPTVIVDLQPGASPQDFLARVNAAATAEGYGENVRVSGPGLPSVPGSPVESVEVAAYRQVVSTPIALAAILAVLAAATVSFALVTSVRRRRRDFGTLQALGFSRAQVRATVAWHAAIVALVATVIGVPLGVIAGRIAWLAAARQIGVPESAAVPWTFVVLAPVVALVAANVVAALPARSAAMTAPAEALRDE